MLKALELVGFKSFADKTRFDFPPGITVVVGPNGSGKSNVVDAIRWVLGEQSVKSLRGKEMADVIFNGSGGRLALNAAETTLTFDNQNGLLPIDTPEVHVTRRVYRSGEGEYLINRQPCRLRDIREMFSGTGVGGEGYSIIEQGKVDVLLQSSARDRRAIFEDAAGIGRFKAKKVESLRRLERVEQNLLRLADIVEEVENRLKSVRHQAIRARRYREYADRLQQLRTEVGLTDWRRLSERLGESDAEMQALRAQASEAAAAAAAAETALSDADFRIDAFEAESRRAEGFLSEARQAIAGHHQAIEHQTARAAELDEESAKQSRQCAALRIRAGDTEQQFLQTAAGLAAAETADRAARHELQAAEAALAELTERLRALRASAEARRASYAEQMRLTRSLGAEISALESQQKTALAACQRDAQRLRETEQLAQTLAATGAALRQEQDRLAEAALVQRDERARAQAREAALRQRAAALHGELAQLRERLSAARERASLLEELELRQEGLGAGVKQLLAQARDPNRARGPLDMVLGPVAELLHVAVENAPLIDVALGEVTGYLAIVLPSGAAGGKEGSEILAFLQQQAPALAGRVGFVPLEAPPAAAPITEGAPTPQPLAGAPALEGSAGVIARADRLVQAAPHCAALAERLLGRTWVVRTLADALALAGSAWLTEKAHGITFVTANCELLMADGTVVVGPRQAHRGLISRKSELRAVRASIGRLQDQETAAQAQLASLHEQAAAEQECVRALSAAYQGATEALAEHRQKVGVADERQAQVEEQRETLTAELQAAEFLHTTASDALVKVHGRLQPAEDRLAELESESDAAARQLEELETSRQDAMRDSTAARVAQAKTEELVTNLAARLRQFEHDQHERRRALADAREALARCLDRGRQAVAAVLEAESALALLYLHKEALAQQSHELAARQNQLRSERGRLHHDGQALRQRTRDLEEQVHKVELAAGEVRLERAALASRLRDDYGIELAELEQKPSGDELPQRGEVDQEIGELRRKLAHLGNVNLDALAEVDEIEARYATLSSQFQDLSAAKASLEQIINRINAESRRLFVETLEMVRGHFQNLFRKLFGGGQADIVLEEGVDILECGIDIVARPPGKELRSITLLSGGEKTLTCVALLLSIFRSRPSPFCVLDEVDAALDEANIERFVALLKEFLDWTQFIVVTHSKKTMTCASTLYGVTMQESGISKRVAVRFEDVSEQGEIVWSDVAKEEEAA